MKKSDLKNFSISLAEARNLKITKSDLKGIKEIIPNEKYKVRGTVGSRKSETVNGTLLLAIKRRKELDSETISNPSDSSLDLMFEDAVNLYFEDCTDREKRDEIDINTIYDHYRKINAEILPYFKKYKLTEITPEIIENFYRYLRNRPKKTNLEETLSEQTVRNFAISLNVVLNFCVLKKLLLQNPATFALNKPTCKRQRKELKYFNIKDAIYALRCIDKFADIRLKCFLNIIFSLGCRREEVTGLRWCDIDFETYEVNYNYAITSSVPKRFVKNRVRSKKLKTNRSYRTNYLSDSVISCLKNYYEFKIFCGFEINETDYIFTTYENNTVADPNKLSEQWAKFKKRYRIKPVDLHRIRHTVANILEKQGIPKKDIAEFLGNTERVLQEYYTHVDTQELKRMRNTLDESLFNKVDSIAINIDLIVKILNDYPMSSFNEDELIKLDFVSGDSIDEINFDTNIYNIKKSILESNSKMIHFIDDDQNRLKIKIETFKNFNQDLDIRIKKVKNVVVRKSIFDL